MARNEEQILVRIINKVEGADELVKEENLLKTLQKSNGDLTRVYEKQTNTQRTRITVNEKSNKEGKKQIDVNREVLAQGPRFQMHLLGIMFGGMALNRAMANLTATSKEWVGISEIMSTTMGVVMLPATIDLLEFGVLPLSEALLGLPTDIQTIIGVTVFGLEGLGKIAEFGGQIALGVGAFSIAFPALAASIGAGLTSALSKNLGKGIVLAVGLTIAWQSLKSLTDGVTQDNSAQTIMSVLGLGLGTGLIGLTFLGVAGGLATFTLAVGVGLLLTWSLAGSKVDQEIRDLAGPGFDFGPENLALTKGSTIIPNGTIGFGGSISENIGSDIFSGVSNTAVGGTNSLDNSFSGGSSSSFDVTYNVSVSDKREFEDLLKKNNDQLVREVRRNATV